MLFMEQFINWSKVFLPPTFYEQLSVRQMSSRVCPPFPKACIRLELATFICLKSRIIPKAGDIKVNYREWNALNRVRFSVAMIDYNWRKLLTTSIRLECYDKF